MPVTVAPLVLLKPGLHVYVVAPEATKVAVPEEQIVCGVTLNVGNAFTVTVLVLTEVQPPAFVPATVYTVVAEGVTATVEVVALPALALQV